MKEVFNTKFVEDEDIDLEANQIRRTEKAKEEMKEESDEMEFEDPNIDE